MRRILLADALPCINGGQLRAALWELRGENVFDLGFSICMAWLTVEAGVIGWNFLRTGVFMLIAETPKPFGEELARRRPKAALDAEPERRQSADTDKPTEGKAGKG